MLGDYACVCLEQRRETIQRADFQGSHQRLYAHALPYLRRATRASDDP